MTDRVFGFHVLLDHDYRVDDVQPIMDAVQMIKGVKAVEIHISTPEKWAAWTDARIEVSKKLMEFARTFINFNRS